MGPVAGGGAGDVGWDWGQGVFEDAGCKGGAGRFTNRL